MAERSHWWTDRWLRFLLFLSLSVSFSDYLPTYTPIYLCIHLSLSLSLSVCLSTYLSIWSDPIRSDLIYRSDLSIYLSICLSIYLSIRPSVRPSIHPSIHRSIDPSIDRSIHPSIYLSASLQTKLFCETSSVFKTWQHQKRSNSARLPQFLHLTTSKTKQFCETSFKNGKLSGELTASYQCVLRFFQSICLNYCACHEKVMPGHTKCCTCHAKSSQQTWKSEAPKCNPSQEISARTS